MESIWDWLDRRGTLAMRGKGIIGLVGLIVVGTVTLFKSTDKPRDEDYKSKMVARMVNSIANRDTLTTDDVRSFFVDTLAYQNNVKAIKMRIDSCVHCYLESRQINRDQSVYHYKCFDATKKDTLLIKTDFNRKIISVDTSPPPQNLPLRDSAQK